MKLQRTDPSKAFRIKLLAASAALAFNSGFAIAQTSLADVPLVNSTTLAVPPNLALIIDDSSSMDRDYMPDAASSSNYCGKWFNYNTLAYNPAITYLAPIKADKTRFPDANFSAALEDGYFAVGAKIYDGSTNNSTTDLNFSKTAIVTFPDFGSRAYRVTSVILTRPDNSTVDLLASSPSPASGTTDEDAVGTSVASSINNKSATSRCTASYNSSNNQLTVTCQNGAAKSSSNPVITLQKTNAASGTSSVTYTTSFGNAAVYVYYATHKTGTTYTTTCGSNSDYNIVTDKANITAPGGINALTNYANWYSYYRNRGSMMKAGVGEAFASLEDGKFRVGYFTINSVDSGSSTKTNNTDLKFNSFEGSFRSNFYDKVYSTRLKSGVISTTPLRGALSRLGKIYSGKVAGWDPVQYSCQRNFTLLTTDGYWNIQSDTTTYNALKEDDTAVKDQDGATGVTRPEFDSLASENSLADIAYYYYHNDLRTSGKSNCTGAPRADASTGDVCFDDVPGSTTATTETDYAKHQHMTTYTLGLGVTGTMTFDPNYKTQNSGAYFDLKKTENPSNWPDPQTTSSSYTVAERIDDLWHAAVNGRGLYLSAKNPEDLATSLATALNNMQKTEGAGAGAAAANLRTTSGKTDIYVAEYTTDEWWGDVAAYDVNVTTGEVSTSAKWNAGTLLDARIGSAGDSDDRTIYVSVDGERKEFTWTNLNAQQKAYFDNTKLSQYAEWNTTQKGAATGETMVNYLRGHKVNEADQNQRLYRIRAHVLGDIVHALPAYVKESYNTFVTDRTYGGRMGMLYVAANDGMLHAFCTESAGACTPGKELWAYVIPPVMKNMWYLADGRQQGYHHYFVDGPLSIHDVQIEAGGQWRTLLVGGLGKGGRAYYAIDITDPADPDLLWTFAAEGEDDIVNTDDDNPDLGYSYGMALSAQVNGNWRILVTSGYNNIPDDPKAGDFPTAGGGGHIFLLDPANGYKEKERISTGAGSPAVPSGLAQITTHVPNLATGNVATTAYGGDLNGDMWRFDLIAKTATKVIATGSAITTGTSISTTSQGHTVLLFGTGRYLGQTDLTDPTQNYIVAVKADKTDLGLNSTSKMLDRTGIALNGDPEEDMNWNTYNGWYRSLGASERVHLDPVSVLGYALFATVIPTPSECTPGGSGNLYTINIDSGAGDGTHYSYPPVGFTVIVIDDPDDPTNKRKKKFRTIVRTSDRDVDTELSPDVDDEDPANKGQRIMWRELID